MKRLVSTAIAGFVLVSCANAPLPSIAADNPNILILGEDADRDSVPRNSRVFRRVLDALSNQLNEQGFNVYDETAVTLDDFAQGRARRTDAEIIDIARLVKRPPIDVAVIFQIYASANQLAYTTKIKTRITGRLLNARTGQRFDSFEVESPAEWTGPRDCPRECLLEVVGGKARILANHLGAVLTEKLAYLAERGDTAVGRDGSGLRNAYNLVFDGFNERDINGTCGASGSGMAMLPVGLRNSVKRKFASASSFDIAASNSPLQRSMSSCRAADSLAQPVSGLAPSAASIQQS